MKLNFPFDPLERSASVESIVMRDNKRAYHRFRSARYYGGIATADAVGCSFLCAYCWNYFRNLNPGQSKEFYSAHRVATKLLSIAQKRSFRLFRITGAEPLLGEKSLDHLEGVLEIICQAEPESVFILETNGFFLGYRPELAEKLNFKNLRIRVCLKGTDEESFELITGAKKEYFEYPFRALKELERQGIQAWPALMEELFYPDEIDYLEKRLRDFGISSQLEFESLEAYPFVVENMRKRGILKE